MIDLSEVPGANYLNLGEGVIGLRRASTTNCRLYESLIDRRVCDINLGHYSLP
jgi:hypothetical protein